MKKLMSQLAGDVERALAEYCQKYLSGPDTLVEAMRYSLEAGGKRVRPVLILLTNDLLKGDRREAMIPAAAIEMIHTFSLIHDDLPAMDNDDFRRGRPTCHKVYGEAMAILAGDGLLAFAFELIGKHYPGPTERAMGLIRELAEATGPGGMTGGQAMDMNFSGGLAEAEKIHQLKTAALIRAACRMGAISAGATEADLAAISEYGLKLGLAFQVVDDYLDQTASQADLGKKAGKDAEGHKPNYALLAGNPAAAWNRAKELIDQAKAALKNFGPPAQPLEDLAELVLTRKS